MSLHCIQNSARPLGGELSDYAAEETRASAVGFHEQRGEKEIGADILLRISEEFGKSIEWSLTGKE